MDRDVKMRGEDEDKAEKMRVRERKRMREFKQRIGT